MCGHVGVAGKIFRSEEQAFRNMLVFDSLRGEDSTGVAVIHRDKTATMVKKVGDPFNVIYAPAYDDALKKPVRAIIGHNRFATVGGVSEATAHPFEFPTLIGAHNGTLKNKYRLDSSKNFTVDSENLFHHIDKLGLTDALSIIDGAWALVWWNKVEKTLNFLRNDERPMFMAMSQNNDTLFWASELWMLSIALSRNGIKHQEILSLEKDTHLSIHIDDKGVLGKPHIKPAPSTRNPHFWEYSNVSGWDYTEVHTSSVTPITPKKPTLTLTHSSEKKTASVQQQDEFVKQYLKSVGVRFEIAAQARDVYGASYLALFDPKNPQLAIRLYLKKSDPLHGMVGREIIADIGSHTMKNNEGFIFKVAPQTVTLCPEKPNNVEYLIYRGANNKLFTKKEWEEKFPTCAWCFSALDADAPNNRITSQNDCLCGTCVRNPDAIEGVTLSKIY